MNSRIAKVVDLFCGVGGLTHGLIKSGLHVSAGFDSDKTCKYAYEANNVNEDGTRVHFVSSDVSLIDSRDISSYLENAKIRVLVGCAPCQPFSNHQKEISMIENHDKWGLLNSFIAHINNLHPEIVSMENVSNIVNHDIFFDFINQLEQEGYYVNYKVVNAADYGVPQRRRRLILLASKFGDIELMKPTHFGDHITLWDAIGHLSKIGAGEENASDRLHTASKLNDINLERIRNSVPGGTWRDWPRNILPHCYRRDSGKTYSSVYGRMEWNKVSPTLTTQFILYGTGRFGHPEQDRAVTIREGALLQTFPKEYSFVEEGDTVLRTVLARQIGNAVPVKLGEVVGKSIINHINDHVGGMS